MLLDIFCSVVNNYDFPGEGWDEDAEMYFNTCLKAGHSEKMLLAVIEAARKYAHEQAQIEHYQPW